MTFKVANIITLSVLALLVLAHFFIRPVHWWYFALLAVAYTSLVFIGCVRLSLDFFTPAICSVKSDELVVTLTFDDGPHPVHTPKIIEILRSHNAPASFFMIGKNIHGNEHLLPQMIEDGHAIGNHTYSHHFWFDMFSSRKMLADMQQMDTVLNDVLKIGPASFRPPYGVMNPNLARAIQKSEYITMGWSLRSFDTRIKDPQKLLSRIMGKVKSGDIILLHDSMEITAAILPELLQQLKARGYTIITHERTEGLYLKAIFNV